MALRIRCPKCGKINKAPDDARDKKGACSGCKTIFSIADHVIPAAEPASAAVESAEDADKLYQRAMELFSKEKYRKAASILEQVVEFKPDLPKVHFNLGLCYSQIGGEYGKDEDAIRPWAKKSRKSLRRAIKLAEEHGGLSEKQLTMAQEAVKAFDRVMGETSPSQDEDRRRKIYADFITTRESELLLGTNLAQEIQSASFNPLAGLGAMAQSLQRNTAKAEQATLTKITRKYGITEAEVQAIVQEGKKKSWPFRGVH